MLTVFWNLIGKVHWEYLPYKKERKIQSKSLFRNFNTPQKCNSKTFRTVEFSRQYRSTNPHDIVKKINIPKNKYHSMKDSAVSENVIKK